MQGHFTSQWVLIEKCVYLESCWISKIEHFGRIIIAFNYFCKTHHLISLWGFRICLSFKYVRFLNIPEFPVCQGSEFPGLHRQGSEYDRVLNMHWDAIVEGFWIFQISNRVIPMGVKSKKKFFFSYFYYGFNSLRWKKSEKLMVISFSLQSYSDFNINTCEPR